MFDFTLFLPRIFFSVFGLESSKNLSLKLARLSHIQLRKASRSLHNAGTAHIQAWVDLPSNTHVSAMYDKL